LTPLVKCNFESPITIGWFNTVWQQWFPFLYTESASPQCPECYDFDVGMKERLVTKDLTGYYTLKGKKGIFNSQMHLTFTDAHLQDARALFKLTEVFHHRSKCYGQVHTFYLDHMASKAIPKFRKEKADVLVKRSPSTSSRWCLM
jgi:hypothetical protein